MATVVRSTPASTLGLSQTNNAAPVHEFRCMFTHDIFKKQKKWHDGSLRFHTFNRRVMVYDDAKNFVGDLHYRQAEDFDEGLEFQLDKPVKVVVEERLGESRTDLTAVLQRPRTDVQIQPNNTSQSFRTPVPRADNINSQARPKSIRELLGPSQRQLGRAMLSQRSPFEQRQALVSSGSMEPPAKKRKVAEGKENVTHTHSSPLARSHIHGTEVIQQRTTTQTANIPQGSCHGRETVVELSSDDDDPLTSRPNARPASNRNKSRVSGPSPKGQKLDISTTSVITPVHAKQKEGPSRKVNLTASPSSVEKVVRPANKAFLNKNCEISSRRSSDARDGSSSFENSFRPRSSHLGPRSSLSFAVHPPRPKMMYKALLPDHRQAGEHLTAGGKHRSVTGQKKSTMADIDDFFEEIEQDNMGLHDHFSKNSETRSSEKNPSTDHIILDPELTADPTCEEIAVSPPTILQETPFSSPIFVSQSESQIPAQVTQHRIATDFEIPPDTQVGANLPESPSTAEDLLSQDLGRNVEDDFFPNFAEYRPRQSPIPPSAGEVTNNCHATPTTEQPQQMEDFNTIVYDNDSPIVATNTDKSMDLPVVVGQYDPVPVTKSQSHPPFRRIRSEADAESDNSSPELASILGGRQLASGPKVPLQRTVSDSAVLNTTQTLYQEVFDTAPISPMTGGGKEDIENKLPEVKKMDIPRDIPQDVTEESRYDKNPFPVEETGPWTVDEAFLLFDHWPLKKRQNKPDYGQTEIVRTIRSNVNANSCLQESRREVQLQAQTRKYGNFGSARFVSQR